MDIGKVIFWVSGFGQIYIFNHIYMLMNKEKIYKIRMVLLYSIYIVLLAIVYLDKNNLMYILIISLLIFCAGLFAYDYKRTDRFYCGLTGAGIILISYVIACTIVMGEDNIGNQLLLMDIIEIVVFFIIKKIGSCVKISSQNNVYFLLIIYFLGVINILRALFIKSQYIGSVIISFTFLHVLVTVAIDAIIKLKTQVMKQNTLNKQIEYYKNELNYLEIHNSDIRGIKHDLNNHMNVLKQLVEDQENNRAVEYIRYLQESIDSSFVYVTTGNYEIDSIFNSKINIMKNNGIKCIHKVIIPEKISINPVDCIVIIGNVIDNAITAVKELKINDCSQREDINITLQYIRD